MSINQRIRIAWVIAHGAASTAALSGESTPEIVKRYSTQSISRIRGVPSSRRAARMKGEPGGSPANKQRHPHCSRSPTMHFSPRGKPMRFSSLLVSLPIGIAALASCTSNSTTPAVACGPDDVATTTSDVVLATNYESSFYFAGGDPIPVGLFTFDGVTGAVVAPQATMAASAVAAAVGNNFPNGCATATANQNVVTFNLNNCSGPLGLRSASGHCRDGDDQHRECHGQFPAPADRQQHLRKRRGESQPELDR